MSRIKKLSTLSILASLGLLVYTMISCKSHKAVSEQSTVNVSNPRDNNVISEDEPDVSPSTLIIFYDDSIGSESLLKAVEDYKAELIYNYRTMHGIAIRIPTNKNIQDAIKYFQSIEGVITVNRDRRMKLH